MRAMRPVANELFPAATFRLRDLRFMMRKDIVHAAAMKIDLFVEERGRHRAALDMPARPAASPGTFPPDVAILFVPRFPEREIADVFLVVLIALDAAGGAQFRKIEMGE